MICFRWLLEFTHATELLAMKAPVIEVILIVVVAFFVPAQKAIPVSLLVGVPETKDGEKAVVSMPVIV